MDESANFLMCGQICIGNVPIVSHFLDIVPCTVPIHQRSIVGTYVGAGLKRGDNEGPVAGQGNVRVMAWIRVQCVGRFGAIAGKVGEQDALVDAGDGEDVPVGVKVTSGVRRVGREKVGGQGRPRETVVIGAMRRPGRSYQKHGAPVVVHGKCPSSFNGIGQAGGGDTDTIKGIGNDDLVVGMDGEDAAITGRGDGFPGQGGTDIDGDPVIGRSGRLNARDRLRTKSTGYTGGIDGIPRARRSFRTGKAAFRGVAVAGGTRSGDV